MRKIKTSTPLSCFVAFRIFPVYAASWCLLLLLLSIVTQTEGLKWRTVQYKGFHNRTAFVFLPKNWDANRGFKMTYKTEGFTIKQPSYFYRSIVTNRGFEMTHNAKGFTIKPPSWFSSFFISTEKKDILLLYGILIKQLILLLTLSKKKCLSISR